MLASSVRFWRNVASAVGDFGVGIAQRSLRIHPMISGLNPPSAQLAL